MNKGVLIVVSGFSGSGKGTLMKQLMADYSSKYALSISATTRNPRVGEVDGQSYFFKTKEEFEQMIEKGELIEYAKYVDNYYGTPKEYVYDMLSEGKNVILEIEIQGALNIKKQFPDACLMFVTTPSADELKRRLVGRGTETIDVIEKRLSRACVESQGVEEYDYIVVNDDVKDTADRIDSIIANVRDGKISDNDAHLVANNISFINDMREQLLSFSKGE